MSVLPPHIRAVLFDKDGTLVDFDRTWAATAMAGARDFAGDDEAMVPLLLAAAGWDPACGGFARDAPIVVGSNAEIARLWRDMTGRPYAADDAERLDSIFARTILDHVAPLGDLKGMAARLRGRGLVLGVATHDSRASSEQQLTVLGVRADFAFVTGYDGPCAPKPDPEAVREFARLAGCAPEDVAVAGDSRGDLALARAGGALAIGVSSDESHRAMLAQLADLTIASIDEL